MRHTLKSAICHEPVVHQPLSFKGCIMMKQRQWLLTLLLFCGMSAVLVSSVQANPFSFLQDRTQCRVWDDEFSSYFQAILWITPIFVVGLTFLIVPLGKKYWTFANPLRRVLLSTLVVFIIAVFITIGWSYFGLGLLWYKNIDPAYIQCTMDFGARGFFDGAVGKNIAAISQRQIMLLFLVLSTGLGGLVAWLITVLWLRFKGVPAQV